MRTATVAIALFLLATDARAVTIQLTCTDGRRRTAIRGRGHRGVLEPPYQYEACDIDHRRDGVCTFAIEADCLRWILGPLNSEPPCVANLDHPCDPCSPADRIVMAAPAGRRPAKLVKRFGYRNRIRIVMRCRRARQLEPPTVPAAGDLSGGWTLAGAVTSGECTNAGPFSNPVEDTLYVQQVGATLRARGRVVCGYVGTTSGTAFALTSHSDVSCPSGPGLSPFTADLDGALTSPDGALLRQRFMVGAGSCPACAVTWQGTMARRSCASHADCTPLDACGRCVDGACR
jgi:hypothetical protein